MYFKSDQDQVTLFLLLLIINFIIYFHSNMLNNQYSSSLQK
jgi:hypothetical protein